MEKVTTTPSMQYATCYFGCRPLDVSDTEHLGEKRGKLLLSAFDKRKKESPISLFYMTCKERYKWKVHNEGTVIYCCNSHSVKFIQFHLLIYARRPCLKEQFRSSPGHCVRRTSILRFICGPLYTL